MIFKSLRGYKEVDEKDSRSCTNCSFSKSYSEKNCICCSLFHRNSDTDIEVKKNGVCYFFLHKDSPITGFYTFMTDFIVEFSRCIRDMGSDEFILLFVKDTKNAWRLRAKNKGQLEISVVKVNPSLGEEVGEKNTITIPEFKGDFSLRINVVSAFLMDVIYEK